MQNDNWGMPYQSPTQFSAVREKHSALGITSFALSLLTGFGLFALIVVAGVIESTTPGGMDEESPAAMIVGLLVLGGLGADVVALVLGIAAMFQQDRKILFGVLGAVFSGLTLLGVVGLMAIGLTMSK